MIEQSYVHGEDLSDEEIVSLFERDFMTTREDIFKGINWAKRYLKNEPKRLGRFSDDFCQILVKYIDKFKDEIENNRTLPNRWEPYWAYSIMIDYTGIALSVKHYSDFEYDKRSMKLRDEPEEDEAYELIKIKSRLLDAEEFANLYNVGSDTVRQWIRRGKIRTAIKSGRDWKIYELTDIPQNQKGYKEVVYKWHQKLNNVPEKYAYLNEFESVRMVQNKENKNLFNAIFYLDSGPEIKSLEKKEREKLEAFLIGHPEVEFVDSCLTPILQID